MDDVLDLIQDTGESLVLYDIRNVDARSDRARGAAAPLRRARASRGEAHGFDGGRPAMLEICQEIDKLESDADKVMRDAISRLFREESDVRQVIKLKAVYEALESATDKCKDVADVIESVVLENA
jgi:uncharacterized protein Yka (UPF0111/DUF47 family)